MFGNGKLGFRIRVPTQTTTVVGGKRCVSAVGEGLIWYMRYIKSSRPKHALFAQHHFAVTLFLLVAWSQVEVSPHNGDWKRLRYRGHCHRRRWSIWVSNTIGNCTVDYLCSAADSDCSFDISSMSAIIGTTQYKCYFNQGPPSGECTGPRSSVQGGITASMAGGSFIAALFSGFLSDMFGRKIAIMVGSCIW